MFTLVRRKRFLALAAAALLAAGSAADTVETTDGKTVTGKVVAQTATAVTVEVRAEGMTFRRNIPVAKVKHVTRDVAEGPGYYPLPIVGEIGVDVTAEALGHALAEVRRAKPDYVVLVIDTPGGNGAEMVKVCQVIRDNADLKFIAYVKHGFSAGAVIAMACPQIYMAPAAVIGASAPVGIGAQGKATVLDEKVASAVRAEARAAASVGGHSDLILRGMMEPELELVLATDPDGHTQVCEANTALFGAKSFKAKGRILTLTAQEAVECGLASGIAADVDGIKLSLGISAWHKSDDAAWFAMTDAGRHNRTARDDQERHAAERLAQAKQGASAFESLQAKCKAAAAKEAEAHKKVDDLKKEYQAELDAAQADYKQAMAGVNTVGDTFGQASAVTHRRNVRLKAAQQKYPALIDAAAKADEKAVEEYNALVTQLNKIAVAGAGG